MIKFYPLETYPVAFEILRYAQDDIRETQDEREDQDGRRGRIIK